MRSIALTLRASACCLVSSPQFVARLEAKEPIAGVCNLKNIIVPFPNLKGQEAAIAPLSKQEIETKLNAEIKFLTEKTDCNDNGMIGLLVPARQQNLNKSTAFPHQL